MEGQVSIEYINIIIIGLFLISVFYFYYYINVERSSKYYTLKRIIYSIGSAADDLCFESDGARRELNFVIPVPVNRTISDNRSFSFGAMGQDFVYRVRCYINLTGEFKMGPNKVILEKENGIVQIKVNVI